MVYIFRVLFSVISWLLKLALRLWEPTFRWVLLSTAGPRCCSVQTSADRLQVKLSKHIVGTTIRSRSPISVFEGEVAACEQNFSENCFFFIDFNLWNIPDLKGSGTLPEWSPNNTTRGSWMGWVWEWCESVFRVLRSQLKWTHMKDCTKNLDSTL